MLDDPDWDDYMDAQAYADDKPVGTVVDHDRETGEFYFEPSPELPKNTWEALGWADDEYDENWADLDYERWRAGEADLTVNYDEWPYTLPVERLRDDGDRLQVNVGTA